ncbi:hypothetical protein [Streptomyces sp. NPDC001435]|uniref:hypothetical protein n=1 Tax=unclassified Streptomyces TaxID=2593676 RepID=UPI00368E9BE5
MRLVDHDRGGATALVDLGGQRGRRLSCESGGLVFRRAAQAGDDPVIEAAHADERRLTPTAPPSLSADNIRRRARLSQARLAVMTQTTEQQPLLT